MAGHVPDNWASIFRAWVWRLGSDPLFEGALVYVVTSVLLRVGTLSFPSDMDHWIANASGVITTVLLLVGGVVVARRLLRQH